MKLFRQGDVLIREVAMRPKAGVDVRESGRVILAHGEVTGHAHEVVTADPIIVNMGPQYFEEPDGKRFLFVDQDCLVTHQEHGPIPVGPGCYEIVRQREYTPERIRQVVD